VNPFSSAVPIERLEVSAYKVPTDKPESDGTLEWNSTTLVLVEVGAGGMTGVGFRYADRSTATLIADQLKPVVAGRDATAIADCWNAMVGAIRNLGRPGICSMAIAAVDNALWDLKGRLLSLPVVALLGGAARCGAGLWQRRFHFLFDRRVAATVERLGERGNISRPRSCTGAWIATPSACARCSMCSPRTITGA
jgi:L-alanine-DL-glutamate epimerase-like enolase superfamily enzyme